MASTGKPAPTYLDQRLGQTDFEGHRAIPTRHLLTRSFRARRFEPPDIVTHAEFSGSLLLATDGFWAEQSEKDQARFLGGDKSSTETERDDRSVLLLRLSLSDQPEFSVHDKSSDNLYWRN
ncbi:hypothetical protein N181_31015 [Sinorhizobium fredii USDA 205]|nr:hypothetical protein N181_31015 [Sinorhizobium fredii USDA 205]